MIWYDITKVTADFYNFLNTLKKWLTGGQWLKNIKHTFPLCRLALRSLPSLDHCGILLTFMRWTSSSSPYPCKSCPTIRSGSNLYSFARKNPSSARSVSIFSNFVDKYRADAVLKSNGHGTSDGRVNAERTQISHNYPQKCGLVFSQHS